MSKEDELECADCLKRFEDEPDFDAHQKTICDVDTKYQKIQYSDRVVYRLREPDEPTEVKGMELFK